MEAVETAVRLRPRRRTWDRNRPKHEEVDLTVEALTALFGMRLADAARSLGVSVTTFKAVCRRLGIERWPYSRRGRARGQAAVRAADASAGEESTDLWFLAMSPSAFLVSD